MLLVEEIIQNNFIMFFIHGGGKEYDVGDITQDRM
jgi:hypothetical protein